MKHKSIHVDELICASARERLAAAGWSGIVCYAAPVENIVFGHQRQYYRAHHAAQQSNDAGVFIDFMLEMILRTIKAKGEARGGKKKVVSKSGKKTAERILDLMIRNPRVTFADMVAAHGISRSAIQKHITHLKDALRLRRLGPDKGGSWEAVR